MSNANVQQTVQPAPNENSAPVPNIGWGRQSNAHFGFALPGWWTPGPDQSYTVDDGHGNIETFLTPNQPRSSVIGAFVATIFSAYAPQTSDTQGEPLQSGAGYSQLYGSASVGRQSAYIKKRFKL